MSRKPGRNSPRPFFQQLFRERPYLLESSNEEILEHWRDSNPGKPIDQTVKAALYNVKSAMRSKGGHAPKEVARSTTQSMARPELEQLEYLIDECLHMARQMQDRKLDDAIDHLRAARNRVVWEEGEPE
jgi:hypothetical protein